MERKCEFNCPRIENPQIRGRCPAVGIADKDSAINYCKSVIRTRRSEGARISARAKNDRFEVENMIFDKLTLKK